MVKIGGQKNGPNTLVSAAYVRGRTLADKVYSNWFHLNMWVNVLALKSVPQIAAKTGNPAGLQFRRIWYSVGKSGVLGITEYRQGRPPDMFVVR